MIDDYLLSIILFAPFLGASILFFIPNTQKDVVRSIAAFFSGISLLASLFLFYRFDISQGGYQFMSRTVWSDTLGISFFLGVDGIGTPMVLASALLMFCGVFVSWDVKDRLKEFYINLLVLGSATMGVYMSLDLFFLFFFYELSVIPMYLFLIIWGRHTKGYKDMKGHIDMSGEEKRESVSFILNFNKNSKEYAAMKLTLYLSLGAVVALMGILFIYVKSGLNTFDLIAIAEKGNLSLEVKEIAFILIFIGFAPIAAIFPFHSWSPVGYAAAPPAASMMHAGVLKKLGHFTIIRICFYLFPEATAKWMPLIAILCVVNIVYGGLVAFLQKDTKFVIGYSSVGHMGYIFLGLASLNTISLTGAVFFLYADAMAMGLLFALAGFIYYQTNTLDIPSLGGLVHKMPFVTLCFVVGGAASFGLPGGMNFVGEVMIFMGAWEVYPIQTIIAALAVVITWAYYFRMTRSMFFGKLNPALPDIKDARTWYERLPLVLLVFFTLFFGIFPGRFISVIEKGVTPILARFDSTAGSTVAQQTGLSVTTGENTAK